MSSSEPEVRTGREAERSDALNSNVFRVPGDVEKWVRMGQIEIANVDRGWSGPSQSVNGYCVPPGFLTTT